MGYARSPVESCDEPNEGTNAAVTFLNAREAQ